jgi:hypothetical protein
MNTPEIETNHTERITLRLRPEDKTAFEQKARERNKDLSEWARETLLASLGFENDHRLMLAELLALRKGVFQVLANMASGKQLTFDAVTAIVAEADERKYVMADKRIMAFVAERLGE